MPAEFSSSLPYILIAAGAGLLGGVIALFWDPNVTIRSAVQHFAAGAVLIAVPITLLFIFLQRYLVQGLTAGASKG